MIWASADSSRIRSIALSALMAALLVWRNSRQAHFRRSGADYGVEFDDFLAESGNVKKVGVRPSSPQRLDLHISCQARRTSSAFQGRSNSKMRRYIRSKPIGSHLRSPGSIFPVRAGLCQSCAKVVQMSFVSVTDRARCRRCEVTLYFSGYGCQDHYAAVLFIDL